MAGNDKDSSASGAKSSSSSSSSRSDGPVKVLLGSSFTSASSSSSSKRGNKHFAITHNFKPESIASSYPGALHPPSSSSASAGSSSTAKDWTLEYANPAFLDNPIYHSGDHGNEAESSRTSHHSATAQEAYGYLGRLLQASSSSTANNNSGNSSNHRDVECVLVYDPERGAYILEKLDASFHFKLERGFNGGRLSQTSKTLLEQQQQQREPKQVSKRQRQEGRQRQKPRPSPSPPPLPPPPPARERTTNTATVFSGRETDSRTLRDSRRSRSSSTSSSADSNGTATPIATSPANSFSDNRNEVVAQHAVTSAAAAAAAVAAPDSKSRRGGRRRRSESGSQQSALSPTQSIESLTARTATLANSSSNSLLKDVNKKQDSGDGSGGDDSHMTAASAAPTPADGMPDEEDAIMEEVATTPASAPTPSATVHLAAPAGASSTSHHKATAQASGVGSPSVTAIPVTPGIPTIPLGAPAGTVTPGGGTATRPARSTSISTGGTGWQPPTTQSVVVDYRKEDFDDDDEEEEDDEEDSGSGSGSGSGSEDDEEDEDVVGLDLDSFAAELDQEMMVEPPTPIDSRRTSFNLSGAGAGGGGGGAASSSNTASNATVASVRQQLLASQQSGSGSKSGRGAKGRNGGG